MYIKVLSSYIDDSSIFSKNEEDHAYYFQHFKDKKYKYSLALFDSKMKIGLAKIDFSRLHSKSGYIIP